jgi:hypothetical protein
MVFLAAMLGVIFSSGCFWRRSQNAHPGAATGSAAVSTATNAASAHNKLIVSPENGLNGTVASANANLRFVVLSFPVGRMPAMDQRLSVYRQGLKVGEVRITGPVRDNNIVADIVAGEAQKDDEVRDK